MLYDFIVKFICFLMDPERKHEKVREREKKRKSALGGNRTPVSSASARLAGTYATTIPQAHHEHGRNMRFVCTVYGVDVLALFHRFWSKQAGLDAVPCPCATDQTPMGDILYAAVALHAPLVHQKLATLLEEKRLTGEGGP